MKKLKQPSLFLSLKFSSELWVFSLSDMVTSDLNVLKFSLCPYMIFSPAFLVEYTFSDVSFIENFAIGHS